MSTGSPVSFKCHACRSTLRPRSNYRVELTGRERPYPHSRYHALGTCSTLVSREYRCGCGHVGWSNHCDLERLAT